MLKLNNIFNRPLTPHLTVYSSQITSVFSIWHRITGITLILILLISLLILKIISNKFYIQFPEIYLNISLQKIIIVNFILFFNYHLLNGLRHIIWDLGFALSFLNVQKSVKFIIINLLCISLSIGYKVLF